MRESRVLVSLASVAATCLFAFVSPVAAQQQPVTVALTAQNGSGITGNVTLTDLGNNQTRVEIKISPGSGDHPAHIHMGSCANLDPTPEFPLANVQNGTSTSVVNQSLTSLMRTQRAVNLHLSPTQAATYVACGDIPVVGSQPPTGVATAPQTGNRPVAAAPAQLPRTGSAAADLSPMLAAGAALITLGLVLRRRFRPR